MAGSTGSFEKNRPMRLSRFTLFALVVLGLPTFAQEKAPIRSPDVRGLATLAPAEIKVVGRLAE